MPLSLRRGTVTAIRERRAGLVHAEVDGAACVAYPNVTGPVALGDEVIVNGQARALGLGSGGFDVLYANLTRGIGLAAEPGAHVIALPYTPLQHAARRAEEDGPLADDLGGTPVVCCSLHSQLVPVCAALRGLRVAYVQLGGGALPVALSDAVRELRGLDLIAFTIAAAPCFGAEHDCVTVASALAFAKARGCDVVACSVGPGIVGTGTHLGHGGLAAAEAANAAAALGGTAVVAVRRSSADGRERHRGVSHHTEAVLALCLGEVVIASDEDGSGWEQACDGLPLSHMGRGPGDDPVFFASAYAAGAVARRLVPAA